MRVEGWRLRHLISALQSMSTVYKSRVGPEILVTTLVTLAGVGSLMAWQRIWVGVALIGLTTAFVLYLFLGYRYRLADDELEISCGALYRKRISIAAIRSLRETRNPISAPAASLDRLEIRYNKYDYVIISPKEKRAFMEHLRVLNPKIEVVETRAARKAGTPRAEQQ